MTDALTKRFNVTALSDTPASTVADLGPTTADNTVVDCSIRQAVGGVMWLAGMTRRPDIANTARAVARYSLNPRQKRWKAVIKILAYLNSTRDLGITYTKGEELSLSVYTYADYASKEAEDESPSPPPDGTQETLPELVSTADSCRLVCFALKARS